MLMKKRWKRAVFFVTLKFMLWLCQMLSDKHNFFVLLKFRTDLKWICSFSYFKVQQENLIQLPGAEAIPTVFFFPNCISELSFFFLSFFFHDWIAAKRISSSFMLFSISLNFECNETRIYLCLPSSLLMSSVSFGSRYWNCQSGTNTIWWWMFSLGLCILGFNVVLQNKEGNHIEGW